MLPETKVREFCDNIIDRATKFQWPKLRGVQMQTLCPLLIPAYNSQCLLLPWNSLCPVIELQQEWKDMVYFEDRAPCKLLVLKCQGSILETGVRNWCSEGEVMIWTSGNLNGDITFYLQAPPPSCPLSPDPSSVQVNWCRFNALHLLTWCTSPTLMCRWHTNIPGLSQGTGLIPSLLVVYHRS